MHWAWIGKITIMLLWRPEFALSFKHYWCVKSESRFCHACIDLCLFSSTEKLACFKIWVILPSKIFFNLCHKGHSGEKKPFQISSFHAATTPRVWDSGTHCSNNCKQWNFLHVTEKENKANPVLVSNSQPSNKSVLLLNCCCQKPYMYLCLSLENYLETFSIHTLLARDQSLPTSVIKSTELFLNKNSHQERLQQGLDFLWLTL